jgi:chaperonin cofactor prefoldin
MEPTEVANKIEQIGKSVNSMQHDLSSLNQSIEEIKAEINYEVAFDSDLKNAEQRNAERTRQYLANEELQQHQQKKKDLVYQKADLEIELEYYRNLLNIKLKKEDNNA